MATGSTPPSRWRSPSPCRRCTSWHWRELADGALRDFKGMIWCSPGGHGDIVASGLTLDRLEGNIAGLGNLDLGQGSARVMALNIAGAGGVKGPDRQRGGRGEHRRQWRGRGACPVAAQDEIAGAGAVNYWGSPALTSEIAGSGQVSRLGSRSHHRNNEKGPSGPVAGCDAVG